MTSTIAPMPPHAGFAFCDPKLAPQPPSEAATLYAPQAGWASALCAGKSTSSAIDYLLFPASTTPPPEHDLQLASPDRKDLHTTAAHPPPMYAAAHRAPAYHSAAPAMYSSGSIFTASHTMASSQNAATISPLQTRFDMDGSSSTFGDPYSSQGPPWALDAQNTMPFSDGRPSSVERHCDSPQTRHGQPSPVTSQSSGGRRRRYENAEPGSARAIYLEKNRKAASKCRSKQKMQQEDLVETARDVERKNRMLKAEVDMLKGGVQELMDIVGQHTNCADGRLRAYVQREADRLAAGARRAPFVPPPLAHMGSTTSTGGHGSPTSTSSTRSRS